MVLPPPHSPLRQRLPRPEGLEGLPLTRRVRSQEALDSLLRRRLVLGLFPMLDERSVRRQRGELA